MCVLLHRPPPCRTPRSPSSSQVHLADALPILSLPAPLPAHLVLHLLDQPSLGGVQRRLSFGRSLVCPAAHHLSSLNHCFLFCAALDDANFDEHDKWKRCTIKQRLPVIHSSICPLSLAQRKSCEAASLPSSTASSLKTNSSDIKKLDNDGIRVTTAKGDGIRVTSNTGDGIRVTSNATDGIRVTPAGEPGPSPSRPKSLALEPMPLPPNNVAGLNPPLKTNNANAQTSSAEERKSAPTPQSSKLPLSKAAETTCKHKHNNANAKELKKLMGPRLW